MDKLAGCRDDLTIFLNMEHDSPLGLCVFDANGAAFMSLEELIEESKHHLSPFMRKRYASAFEVMAKQLRK